MKYSACIDNFFSGFPMFFPALSAIGAGLCAHGFPHPAFWSDKSAQKWTKCQVFALKGLKWFLQV